MNTFKKVQVTSKKQNSLQKRIWDIKTIMHLIQQFTKISNQKPNKKKGIYVHNPEITKYNVNKIIEDKIQVQKL
jgi:hypothetical protein